MASRSKRCSAIYIAEHPEYLQHPQTVAEWLAKMMVIRGYALRIEPRWVGRNRHGVVYILEEDTKKCVFECEFTRNTGRWPKNATDIFSCYCGSPKHHALLAAKDFAEGLPQVTGNIALTVSSRTLTKDNCE